MSGGAARAAYRIHRSLVDHGESLGLYSRMRVIQQQSDDSTVIGGLPESSPVRRRLQLLQTRITTLARRDFQSGNPILHTCAWSDTGLGAEQEQYYYQGQTDVVHLHWLGDNTLSIEEIGRLSAPLIWTLHDQWPFCGAEHYTSPPGPGETSSTDQRFALGYSQASRPDHESGPDLNRRTWLRKRKAWRRPMQIVCPSYWLADCARRSTLMGEWPIAVIPNPLDLTVWAPVEQAQARQLLNLPCDRPLILFGAMGGARDPRKGADLLLAALQHLQAQVSDTPLAQLELMVFGQSVPNNQPQPGFPIHYRGHLQDDLSLRLLYAAADVFVIPSRQDNLPNTGLEAHACGIPVVAFRTGGLADIIDERVTGVLADPFDPASLAAAIRWVLEDEPRRQALGAAARQRAECLWSPERIAALYSDLYDDVAKENRQV